MKRHRQVRQATAICMVALGTVACSPPPPEDSSPEHRKQPSILLVTLDTTRADRLGFESGAADTPSLDALAERGLRFSQAYTTAPMTLPAHTSMLTGLYPSDHGIRENARYLESSHDVLADRLRDLGYTTAAFVSGLPLAGRFGLERGFDHYDDDFAAGAAERSAGDTTDRALAHLKQMSDAPVFLWVHYFDPHEPYSPPEPYRTRYAADPYQGEIAYMDSQLGRLLEVFEARYPERKVVVAGDHGEGLGEHGEALHGNLMYQGVMRVPMILADSDVVAGEHAEPVSVRRIFDTILDWAGADHEHSLLDGPSEVVLAEAMKPFLQYGWQPQVMAVYATTKVIRSGGTEVYDLRADPAESMNVQGKMEVPAELREALQDYPFLPEDDSAPTESTLSQEDRERLASLGYAGWQGRAQLRDDAPSPKDMTHLFDDLDAGSGLFVHERYEEAVPLFRKVLEQDPGNLMVAVRLAVAHSLLGRDRKAMEYFERARSIDPGSADVRHYLAMHLFRAERWDEAAALFESVLAETPGRLPALESLARIREGQGRLEEASLLLERVVAAKEDSLADLIRLGELKMEVGDTQGAIDAFERARSLDGFSHFLELGVCYLANQRVTEARDCLDQVPPEHPGYAMALFKRAQVSVLLDEPDKAQRIRNAYEQADEATRPLIERERLFQGLVP